MFSFFRRNPPPAPTFNERVSAFWRWFSEVAPRFYSTIEAGRCAALTEEISPKVDELLPGFAWVFGPGADGQGHSLTLSGEGNIHRQLLALRWLAAAPALTGWTFHAARQPGPIKGHVIEMSGLRFDPKEIWVSPSVDEQAQNVDLTIWHPAWEQITPQQRQTITFLFLDESLGEYGTDWWIGKIEFGQGRLRAAFPLDELSDYIGRVALERGWQKHIPGENWTLFRLKETTGDFPRADIITQSTAVPRLFHDYMRSGGDLEDPLNGSGADYVYVSIDPDFFPKGEEVAKRGEIEDAITAALAAFHGGICIGGAFGRKRCYSDFMLFDGARSLTAIRSTLKALNAPGGTMIEHFAREKRGQRIAI
jgi:hypothetical protein